LGLLVLLVAAGCGGGEREPVAALELPSALATALAGRSDAVAAKLEANDRCGARLEAAALQAETIAAVNSRRVPPRYQEELTASVSALLVSIECPDAESGEGDDEDEGAPAPVAPVPTGSNPAEAARNLGAWLRANSG